MAQIKRETAIICTIKDLLEGGFVKTEGLAPSFFSTAAGDVSRTNIIGVIVRKDEEGIFLDDGTGSMLLRSFEQGVLDNVSVSDVVMVIGKPRMYGDQKYIVPEVLKKVDSKWVEFRRAQLERLIRKAPMKKEEKFFPVHDNVKSTNYNQKIIEFIKDLDDGEGADIDEVIKRSQAPQAEGIIGRLIEEGEIFEVKPGKVKLLS